MGVCRRALIVACAGTMLACASGDGEFADGPRPGFGEDTGTTSAAEATSKFDSQEGGAEASSSGEGEVTPPPDLGECGDDGDCMLADDDACFEQFGTCTDGSCIFAPKIAGVACDDEDPCTTDDECDGIGGCLGTTVEDSTCGSGDCDDGWGDCNGDMTDGCETPLDTASDCGGCGMPCDAGPHATATCVDGECSRSCEAPWENCDDDWSTGCEIPTGVANQCDANGLNAESGCWTAHCGSSTNAAARNFGTWFCYECSTCNVPGAGLCRWCDHGAGTWYPAESCPCGAYEDLVCSP